MTQRHPALPGTGFLDDPTAGLRRRLADLHDLALRPLDGSDRLGARLLAVAGGPGSVLVRSTRPAGWGTAAAALALLAALLTQLVDLVGSALRGGGLDLLAGRGFILLALFAVFVDTALRISGTPLLAVGPAGVALAFPPDYDPAAPRTRVVAARSAQAPIDLVPWRDVAALLHVRVPVAAVAGLAHLGVRLRRPLPHRWPHPPDPGVEPTTDPATAFGTRLLTRPLTELDPARLAALTTAVARHAPGTPLEDVPAGAAAQT
ncbi:hypothetical protein [uncultured Phycicoccus sp.]|uniref:hypothetical protein n=1 Tax=uncultured Phycicoccus sp. TaxID=661422 RepID=UPI002607BBE8|nr:hypothetical protein [uncultured Phycicoccus sp.]